MWPVLLGLARTYAPYLVFPFAVVAGTVGYAIEGAISDRATPAHQSVLERRAERHAKEGGKKEFVVPKTIFERKGKREEEEQ